MFRSRIASRLIGGLVCLLAFVGPALATPPAYTPPDGLEPADIQTAVFATVAPAIPVILGIGATMTIVWAIYRVITRKTAKRA